MRFLPRKHARSYLAAVLVSLAQAGAAAAVDGTLRTYDPTKADQFQGSRLEDTVPADPKARELWARNLVFDATVYGAAPVLIYRQIFDQAVNRSNPAYVGFNRFAHGRTLAAPGYKAFKTPNADTLYSNAYVDLRDGPVLFEVPDMQGRYYTANFLDIFGNASNISTRTFGGKAGRYLIATTDWSGKVPEGVTLFRVTTPIMWILLRVLVTDTRDAQAVHRLQDRFTLQPTVPPRAAGATAMPDGKDESAPGFLRILDFLMRECGYPQTEHALVYRLRGIGIGGRQPLDTVMADPQIKAGVVQGYAEAQTVIRGSMAQNGQRNGAWSEPLDIGRYGYNYLYRSSVNTLGTGANVVDENYPFTAFVDSAGRVLDGSQGAYEIKLAPPPPARYFWSVTIYDQRTRELVPNVLGKYLISDRTPGLKRGSDGSVTIRLQHAPVAGAAKANWLPAPDGPFYLAIRAQGPDQPMLDRSWRPPEITRLDASAKGDVK